MQALTHDEFCKLDAYDRVMPIDHSQRMLGFIAYMIGKYLEMDLGSDDALREVCMPWLPEEKADSSKAIAALAPVAKPVQPVQPVSGL